MLKYSYILLPAIVLMLSCKHEKHHVDTGNIEINLQIRRFEKDLFETDPSLIEDSIISWTARYGRFFQIFNQRIIQIGKVEDQNYPVYLKQFVTDYYNYKIYKKTIGVFENINPLEKELKDAFTLYRYYFPHKTVPEVITFISGFNQSVVSDDSLLAIGLDKYLGSNEELYNLAGIYSYFKSTMYKEKIVSDCMRLWGMTEFAFNDSLNNLAANMVYEGMIMDFVDHMLPDLPDSVKWGMTQKQLEFCEKNEKQMWTYLIENKLLFNSDKFTIDKFIREGPFTRDFSTESPARAAVWIGNRIIKSYSSKNKINFSELMNEKDYLKILNLSGYNP